VDTSLTGLRVVRELDRRYNRSPIGTPSPSRVLAHKEQKTRSPELVFDAL